MPKLYQFRLIKSSWGIFIDFTADWKIASPSPKAMQVTPNLFLELPLLSYQLDQEEIEFLRKGANFMSQPLALMYPNQTLVIHIFGLEMPLTDYQPEGLYFAISGWIADVFNLPLPEVNCRFDMAKNRYIFGNL